MTAAKTEGKVRQIVDLGTEVLLVTTNRISAFDEVLATLIPDKGRILNGMSAFWFEKLVGVVPNHMISVDEEGFPEEILKILRELGADPGTSMRCRKAKPLPIECVARGYIAGSLYKEYLSEGKNVHGLDLLENLKNSDKLPEAIFTPATKAQEGHDENLSWAQTVDLVGAETANLARDWTLKLYNEAALHAEANGLILADTKFEFGETADGIILIDEALTPDSSRYWDPNLYEPGKSQPSYDKQYVRDYLEQSGWNKQPPAPALPADVVTKTREKYLECYRRIVGRPLPELPVALQN